MTTQQRNRRQYRYYKTLTGYWIGQLFCKGYGRQYAIEFDNEMLIYRKKDNSLVKRFDTTEFNTLFSI